ncbi:MAG: ABC transporter ATP-binding protein [Fibrobacterota bacterium]
MIEFKNVIKRFDSAVVLDGIDVGIDRNSFFVILGPSGCGKTTMLNMIAGFDFPTQGRVSINGASIKKPGKDRGFVFQDYALFPWRTVLGNVLSGLRGSRRDRRTRALYYLEKVGLADFAHVYPHTLSGGMKQRVSIARALAYDPDILLMDEPFGALDAQTRKLMQQELLQILKDFNKTIVFVTHSVVEAVYLADRIIVLSKCPSRIILDEKIDLGEQRDYLNRDFLAYREKILRYLDAETGIKE